MKNKQRGQHLNPGHLSKKILSVMQYMADLAMKKQEDTTRRRGGTQ
jgi:hypothetical protein